MTDQAMRKVIISNGFNKFHLAVAAAEAYGRGSLTAFLTGAYPRPGMRRFAMGRKLARFLARREDIPDSLVHPITLPECQYQASRLVGKIPGLAGWGAWLNDRSLWRYARQAAGLIERFGPDASVYHYRAGFGHESVRVAKRLGMVALCDHSIAHPGVLEYLVNHRGQFPPAGAECAMSRFWCDILADIEQADAVLVNSDFVKETFLYQGWDPARVHVIYLGVDDQFLGAVPKIPAREMARDMEEPAQLLFAGFLERRKGGDFLMSTLATIDDQPWRLELLGDIAPDIAGANRSFLADPRVTVGGSVSRAELANRMSAAEIFIFPSLAEGSARVVFEALASGCYVITTPNTGSIVEDGIHGALVPPGDEKALAEAIRAAIRDRGRVREIGERNARLVHEKYRQDNYGKALATLYDDLVARP